VNGSVALRAEGAVEIIVECVCVVMHSCYD
jgi:hypothetical protein